MPDAEVHKIWFCEIQGRGQVAQRWYRIQGDYLPTDFTDLPTHLLSLSLPLSLSLFLSAYNVPRSYSISTPLVASPDEADATILVVNVACTMQL